MHLAVGKFLVVSLVTLWGLPGFASDLVISGWPRPDQNMTADSVLRYTDDPLLGRLACPPLVRFNLAKKNFDHLILRQAKVDDGKWQLTLRNGIYWWSGDEVKASDLVQYLENHLATIVSYKGADLWQIPEFAAKTTGTYGVEVSWKKAPQFGPMVLAGVPLWRKHEATNQCAGLYQITQDNSRSATLQPNPGYRRIKKSIGIDYQMSAKNADVLFQFADNYGGSPWVRFSDEDTDCRHSVALPTFSMVAWNAVSPIAKDPELRKILAMLIPRDALLSYGAGSLGQLVSAPIPKQHPGYNDSVKRLATDLPKAANELERLGYRRPKAEGPRYTPDGKPMKLRFKADSPRTTLVEKTIADTLSAVGVQVEFVHGYVAAGPFDGHLTAVTINSVTSDLLFLLHSRYSMLKNPIDPVHHESLDKLLENYSLSLTHEPDFGVLKKVHSKVQELHPVTVLVQHSACLTGNNSRYVRRLNVNDPDWLKQIVR